MVVWVRRHLRIPKVFSDVFITTAIVLVASILVFIGLFVVPFLLAMFIFWLIYQIVKHWNDEEPLYEKREPDNSDSKKENG